MKILKKLKSDQSLSNLSSKELKTVKGGSNVTSYTAGSFKRPEDDISADPPPEIEAYRCYFH